jgi:hypothetical protein
MKLLVVVLVFIYLIIVESLPISHVNVEQTDESSAAINSRLIFENINCMLQCVQPVGVENEEDDVQNRGIINNYAVVYACTKKCAKN